MSKGRPEHRDLGSRPSAERFFYNVQGACAEAAVAKYLNAYWPALVNQPKHDPDIGVDIQVRCASQNHYRMIVYPDDRDDHKFVLVIGEPPTFSIRGWMMGVDAKMAKYVDDPVGHGEKTYFVPQTALLPISLLCAGAIGPETSAAARTPQCTLPPDSA